MADFNHLLGFNITSEGALVEPYKLKNKGYQAGDKLPAPHLNWFLNQTSRIIDEIHKKSALKLATYYSPSSTNFDLNTTTNSLVLIPKDFAEDCPIASGSGFVYVQQYFFGDISANSNRTQIAFSYGDKPIGGMAIRHFYNGTWSKWCKFYNTDDKPTAVDVGALPLYTSLEQIGLTTGSETIATISNKLPDNSTLYLDITGSNANIYPNNDKNGFLIVEKKRNNRVLFTYNYSEEGKIKLFHGTYVLAYDTWTGWVEPMASDFSNASKALPVAQGGTGAKGYNEAQTNLKVMSRLAMYYSSSYAPDIDTITDSVMLIPHEYSKGCPIGGSFVYIMQLFYGDITANSNRTQIAFPYFLVGDEASVQGNGMAIRMFYNGTWTEWQEIYGDHNKPTPAELGASAVGHGHALTDNVITGILPINKGGTGASDVTNARKNLGLVQGTFSGNGGYKELNTNAGANSNVIFLSGVNAKGYLTPRGGIMFHDVGEGLFPATYRMFGGNSGNDAKYEKGVLTINHNSKYLNSQGAVFDFYCF